MLCSQRRHNGSESIGNLHDDGMDGDGGETSNGEAERDNVTLSAAGLQGSRVKVLRYKRTVIKQIAALKKCSKVVGWRCQNSLFQTTNINWIIEKFIACL